MNKQECRQVGFGFFGSLVASIFLFTGWCGDSLADLVPDAQDPHSPPDLCDDGAACTPAMKAIQDRFNHMGMPPGSGSFPNVYSGECYYLGFGTDPTVTQYGVTLLDPLGSKPQFSALFSFFTGSNTFINLSVAQARVVLKQGGAYPKDLHSAPTFAFVDFPGEKSSIRYWVRQDPRSRQLLLLSLWLDYSTRDTTAVFCNLAPNSIHEVP